MANYADWVVVEKLLAGKPVVAHEDDMDEAIRQAHAKGIAPDAMEKLLSVGPERIERVLAGRKRPALAPYVLKPIVHGSRNGHRLHRNRGEVICDICRDAHALDMRQQYAIQRANAWT